MEKSRIKNYEIISSECLSGMRFVFTFPSLNESLTGKHVSTYQSFCDLAAFHVFQLIFNKKGEHGSQKLPLVMADSGGGKVKMQFTII